MKSAARLFSWGVAIAVCAFLLAPLIVVIAASFSPTPVFDLPTTGASLRWYVRIATLEGFWPALVLSVELAGVATTLSLVIGTFAAIAVVRGALPFATIFAAVLTAPLMMPGLVLGIALLQSFRQAGIDATLPELIVAHLVITLPYVARTMIAGLSRFDFTLIEAAQTLGCPWPRAIAKVMVPTLAPSFLVAGLFSFLASFDNYPVSIFLTDVRTKTLPIKMLQYIEEAPDPTIAAVSSLILLGTIALLILADRTVGLSRMAGTAD